MIGLKLLTGFPLTRSLRAKLALFTALVLVVACSTLGWLFIRQQVTAVTDGLLRSGTLLAQHLAVASRYSVLAGDSKQVARLAQGILATDEVAYVVMVAKEGQIGVSFGKEHWVDLLRRNQELTASNTSLLINPVLSKENITVPLVSVVEVRNDQPIVTARNGFTLHSLVTLLAGSDVPLYYDIGVPIPSNSPMPTNDAALQLLLDEGAEGLIDVAGPREPIGVIEVGVSTLAMQDLLRRLVLQVIGLTLGIMVAGLIAIALLTHRMTIPLRNLTAVATTVAAGNMTTEVKPFDGKDEIGNLTTAFNRMLQSIRSREDALTELNHTLEDRISARTDQLEAANLKLKELDRRKSLFVSTASHELRTPLTSMKVHLENLLDGVDGPVTESQKLVLSRIHVNLGRLQHLLEELLDLSRIELGQTHLEIQAVNVAEAVTHSIESLQAVVLRKGVTIHSQLAIDLPFACADKNKLHQILTNLLHNALKFSPEGGMITISAEYSLDGYLRIAVRDVGPGISTDDSDKIFEPFYRSPHIPSQIRGTGLGLAIAKHLVELHQGRLWAESVLGKGSCFFFTLPVWTPSPSSSLLRVTQCTDKPVR
jgi:signal transduction histidine kinase